MKTIGLIGGLTWLSTLDYYRLLNQMVNEKLGGPEAAKIILFSVNFGEIKILTQAGDWDGITNILCDAAKKVEAAGADCLLIGANTMHKIADKIQAAVHIPVIHIAEETTKEISKQNLKTVALLGTKYTMQQDFYTNKISAHGVKVIIPEEDEIEYINDAIYNEFGIGIFLPERKKRFIEIINRLISRGAQGIVLACTEIPILIKQEDISAPVFDTAKIHAAAAVEFVLS